MANRQFDDGAAVTLRASGAAATVVRLYPQNGADPTNYYEIRRVGVTESACVAEGALLPRDADALPSPADAADAISAETPRARQQRAPSAPPPAPPSDQPPDQAALVAEATALLQEAAQEAAQATTAASTDRSAPPDAASLDAQEAQ